MITMKSLLRPGASGANGKTRSTFVNQRKSPCTSVIGHECSSIIPIVGQGSIPSYVESGSTARDIVLSNRQRTSISRWVPTKVATSTQTPIDLPPTRKGRVIHFGFGHDTHPATGGGLSR